MENKSIKTFSIQGNRIVWQSQGELVWLEPYGPHAIRFRSTQINSMPENDWTLLPAANNQAVIEETTDGAWLHNGDTHAFLRNDGWISYYGKENKLILTECYRDRRVSMTPVRPARCYRAVSSNAFNVSVYFQANKGEHIYGMGQNQNDCFDMKGCVLELAQKNTQTTIPFYISTLGYGFVWNNPSVGRVELAENHTLWQSEATSNVDYLIFAGNSPAEILSRYNELYGKTPKVPDYITGFWQSKCRYESQEELLSVARRYKEEGLPISVIVCDFFHWPEQGDWKFDPKDWPDPKAMVEELEQMGIKLCVSVWPTVDQKSENFDYLNQNGYLIRAEQGIQAFFLFIGAETYYDATNPEARKFIWNTIKKNYYDYGIRDFWLDEAEPEIRPYDYKNLRYYLGNGLEVTNIYPFLHSKAFYDGIQSEDNDPFAFLTRSAWLGSQRFGIILWTGDIGSSFDWLRIQVKTGLNVAMSGIPWWTTDIGGFFDGNGESPEFRELIIRWFQYAVFCPVFRLHGNRMPYIPRLHAVRTGGPNEVWSFGEEAYNLMQKSMELRERLRPYIIKLGQEAAETGAPIMRPYVYEFPEDSNGWLIDDAFLLGPDLLVAPVLEAGMKHREVYLPNGCVWTEVYTGKQYEGGQTILCDTPMDHIPLFLRNNATLPIIE